MQSPFGNSFGLGGLPFLSNAETRSICAENPTGEKGSGARAESVNHKPSSMLGKGWKVRPCVDLGPGSTTVLADIKGPGVIQHIWITATGKAYRDCILRFYWDDETTPSIETPLADFFCIGHGMYYPVNALPICVNPMAGFNCYLPMPFARHARVTIENQSEATIEHFFYQITYAMTEVPKEAAYLHAQWRRSLTTREYPEHVILDGINGQGHYIGTFLAWMQMSNGWWGEGEIKFYMDGDKEFPTICGTGTEDYVGGAWWFDGKTYSTAFLGYPLNSHDKDIPRHALYRFHILDPIRFKKDLKVTIQALGWWPGTVYQPLTDDIASVGYWYQTEPHAPFPAFPPRHERFAR